MFTLGDMTVYAPAEAVPPKLAKALAVVGGHLQGMMWAEGFKPSNACILCSLTVRDFLHDIGFVDARVTACMLTIRAFTPDRQRVRHELVVGQSFDRRGDTPHGWAGHLVVTLPKTGWLVDPTITQAKRQQWAFMTGMAALPLIKERMSVAGKLPLAGGEHHDDDGVVGVAWFNDPKNGRWSSAPDSIGSRRAPIVRALVRKFEPHGMGVA